MSQAAETRAGRCRAKPTKNDHEGAALIKENLGILVRAEPLIRAFGESNRRGLSFPLTKLRGWIPEQMIDAQELHIPGGVGELLEKRPHYLAFLNYPDSVRRTLSTTNAVEAVNGQHERIRRNSGGYFQSEDTLKLKLGIAITSLESGKWRQPAANMKATIDQLNALFEARFESQGSRWTQHS